MITVLDASAVVEYLLGTQLGRRVAGLLTDRDAELHVPALAPLLTADRRLAAAADALIDVIAV